MVSGVRVAPRRGQPGARRHVVGLLPLPGPYLACAKGQVVKAMVQSLHRVSHGPRHPTAVLDGGVVVATAPRTRQCHSTAVLGAVSSVGTGGSVAAPGLLVPATIPAVLGLRSAAIPVVWGGGAVCPGAKHLDPRAMSLRSVTSPAVLGWRCGGPWHRGSKSPHQISLFRDKPGRLGVAVRWALAPGIQVAAPGLLVPRQARPS